MKYCSSVVLLLVAGICSAVAELPAGWSTDFTNALAAATTQQRPVLAYFTADWCAACSLMTRTTLANEAVIRTLTNFSHVAVDIDEHRDLAGKYRASDVPIFQLLTSAGNPVSVTAGYQDTESFLRWLTNGINEVKQEMSRQKEFAEKLARADQFLQRNDIPSLRKAAAELIDLCGESGSAISETTSVRLAALAKRDLALLLDGLNHPRLAARIHIANLFRSRYGDVFDVDPWSEAATRQRDIARWRDKLSISQPNDGRNP